MTGISRRIVLKAGAALTGSILLPRSKYALAQSVADPHFFLQIYIADGVDSSYLFDARPLAFTAAGKIQNYLGQDPTPWLGANCSQTLATSLSV